MTVSTGNPRPGLIAVVSTLTSSIEGVVGRRFHTYRSPVELPLAFKRQPHLCAVRF